MNYRTLVKTQPKNKIRYHLNASEKTYQIHTRLHHVQRTTITQCSACGVQLSYSSNTSSLNADRHKLPDIIITLPRIAHQSLGQEDQQANIKTYERHCSIHIFITSHHDFIYHYKICTYIIVLCINKLSANDPAVKAYTN